MRIGKQVSSVLRMQSWLVGHLSEVAQQAIGHIHLELRKEMEIYVIGGILFKE